MRENRIKHGELEASQDAYQNSTEATMLDSYIQGASATSGSGKRKKEVG